MEISLKVIKTVYITGANGFLGKEFSKALSSEYKVIPLSRKDLQERELALISFEPGSVVIHLAAKVHVDIKPYEYSLHLDEYRKINRDLTINLAKTAIKDGCSLFIFLSSASVYGRFFNGMVDSVTVPRPSDPYGISKFEAESALKEIFSGEGNCCCLVLRPPIIYGPGNKGNMIPLLQMANKGIKLPIKRTKGKRSILFSGNLVNAVQKVITTPWPHRSRYCSYLLSGGHPVTSKELYDELFKNFHNGRTGSWAFPIFILRRLIGHARASKLFDDYYFSCQEFERDFAWSPLWSFEKGIDFTFEWYSKVRKEIDQLSTHR